MANVDLSRVPAYYHKYIALVSENDLKTALEKHQTDLINELKKMPLEKWDYRYADGKWTIKELVQHIIDAERIFCYRALRFSRKDTTELPGFDENGFAENSAAHKRTGEDLINELTTVQQSTAQLFSSFVEEQLDQTGTANGHAVYVKGIGYIVAGHAVHHKNILLERYL
jgi:hypothetical protein